MERMAGRNTSLIVFIRLRVYGRRDPWLEDAACSCCGLCTRTFFALLFYTPGTFTVIKISWHPDACLIVIESCLFALLMRVFCSEA